MTLDGYCDHTAVIADDQLHEHYTELLRSAGTLLYGRVTYQLMESYWPDVVKNPTGNKATDDFARIIDKLPKIVFSHTLKNVKWESAKLANRHIEDEVLALREEPGRDILAGSPGLIVALSNLGLIDEYQLCVHPVIAAGGLPLFKNIEKKTTLKLIKTKSLGSGAIILFYSPQ